MMDGITLKLIITNGEFKTNKLSTVYLARKNDYKTTKKRISFNNFCIVYYIIHYIWMFEYIFRRHIVWSCMEGSLIFGCIAGYGFSSILSGILLFSRFIVGKGLIFKVICCCLFPLTIAIIVYVGVFSFLPYEIYNIYAIIKKKE